MKRPILIAGPTASGKSALAAQLAHRGGGEVINSDSMQVYDVLEVLTARPSTDEMSAVPHHLFGYIRPDESYSVGRWLEDVAPVLADLARRGKRAVFAGGTGLYFKALLEGLSQVPPINPEIRQSLREAAADNLATLYEMLEAKDPQSWNRIRPADGQRIVRALEVVQSTGKPLSWWQARDGGRGLFAEQDSIKIVLEPDRERLRETIANRFTGMVQAGALAEVEALLELNVPSEKPIMRAIGVPEISAYLRGEMSLDVAIERAVTATAQYAKRQSTWFRNQFSNGWQRYGSWEAALADIRDREGAGNPPLTM